MARGRFSWFDITITIVSLLTLLLEVVTDVAVVVQLYLGTRIVWGSVMLAFIVVPHVVINICSLRWHSTDGSLTWSTVLPHVCLLAPFQRYMRVLWLGFKSTVTSHPRYTDAALREQNDASVLRLFETFLESVPQLVLQLVVMLLYPADLGWVRVLSASSSLVSLAWALTVYCDSSRLNYQTAYTRRFLALTLHLLWQLLMVTARVSALVLFTSVFHTWICLFVGIHWVVMTVWIWIKGTDFGHGKLEKALFRIVSGFIYVFVYLNIHEGPSRSRMVPYYCLVFVENGVLFTIWMFYGKPSLDMKIAAAVLVFGGFLLGGLCLMVYYRWLHPSGPHYLFSVKAQHSASQLKGPQLLKESTQEAKESAGDTPTVLNGSTLELSVDTETPAKGLGSAGDTGVSHLFSPAARGALESAWQSGMQSSDSSSCSSLDANECSLDQFNTTAKSTSFTLKENSSPAQKLSQSQSRLSSVTIKPRCPDTACQSSPILAPDASHHSLSDCQPPSEREQSMTPSLDPQNKTETEVDKDAETGEPALAKESLLAGKDGGEVTAGVQQEHRRSRSKLRSSPTPSDVDATPAKPLLQHYPSSTPSAKPHNQFNQLHLRKEREKKIGRFGRQRSQNNSGVVSPTGTNQQQPDTHISTTSSSASDILPPRNQTGTVDRLSQSFDLGESPIVSPDSTRQSCSHLVMSRDTSFLKADREAMAPYPDIVESICPESQQPKMFLGSDDMFGERAGGESMWGISPTISNNSSSQSRDPALSLPASVARLPCLEDSFDSESEPACLNAINQEDLHTTEDHKHEDCPKDSPASESTQSPDVQSPAANNNDTEISWSSMNVNENEWSGLNNLNALTPDDSLCSFGSNHRQETPQNLDEGAQQLNVSPVLEAKEGVFSRSSTPSLPRSRSTSSLCYEFSSAGASPSPPPGLRAAACLSRNHSWVNSPFASQSVHQPADTSWPLDYFSVDPAPPVDCDPREVVIEMLMDQLKRSGFRSNQSPALNESYSSSPMHGRGINTLDQQAMRHLFTEGVDTRLLSHPEQGLQGKRRYRNDIDLMRRALDLIELQRFPHRFRPEAPDGDSPEMYVSGQYRPPIVDQGREPPQQVSELKTQAGHHSQSQLNTSLRQTSLRSASLPPQFSSAMAQHSSSRHLNAAHGSTHQHDAAHPMEKTHPHGSAGSQREGLYRYFVHSNSPIHTSEWNNPHSPPAAFPSHCHFLHNYLTQNTVEVGLREDRVQSAETRSLHRAPSRSGGNRPLSSTLPYSLTAHTGRTSDTQAHVFTSHSSRNLDTVPYSQRATVGRTSSTLPPSFTAHAGRITDTTSRSLTSRRVKTSDMRHLSEKLEVVTDNPDSGMHSGSLSVASRRQPLQSLDNSPSLSPSSVTQQPSHTKTMLQASALNASDKHRHSYRADRSSSRQATTCPGSPKHAARSRQQVQGHREAAIRSTGHDRHAASSAQALESSTKGRAKSVDRLR